MTATSIARRLRDEDAGEVRRVFLERCLGHRRSLEDEYLAGRWGYRVDHAEAGSARVELSGWEIGCTCDEWHDGAICPHVAMVVVLVHPWLVGGRKALAAAGRGGEA